MQRNAHHEELSLRSGVELWSCACRSKSRICCSCCRDELGRVVLGDVITAIDGKEIKLQRDLFEILDERRPGDKIKLEVLRNGQRMAFEVELGGRQLSGTE